MIRFQIIERAGANLHRTLVDAMRLGELRTFTATRRGRRIQHKNLSYPGWMNWSVHDGMINCEVISPRKPGLGQPGKATVKKRRRMRRK
jgi:hypothetical protein